MSPLILFGNNKDYAYEFNFMTKLLRFKKTQILQSLTTICSLEFIFGQIILSLYF